MRLEPVPFSVMFATGTRFVLEEAALNCRLVAVVSTSPTTNDCGDAAVSSSTVTLVSVEIAGASFSGVTVTVNVRTSIRLVAPPSSTVTVTVTTPEALVAGVNCSEPLAAGLP